MRLAMRPLPREAGWLHASLIRDAHVPAGGRRWHALLMEAECRGAELRHDAVTSSPLASVGLRSGPESADGIVNCID